MHHIYSFTVFGSDLLTINLLKACRLKSNFQICLPLQATFPLEILIPLGFLGLMLAILGYFYLTRKGDQDVFLQKTETTGGSAGTTAGSMFAPRPKARPVRPHEFQASAKSQGPQPSLVCICPNLVVPEKAQGQKSIKKRYGQHSQHRLLNLLVTASSAISLHFVMQESFIV